MPLFGKKKSSSGASGGAGYPKQQAYPTQPAYPTQQPYPTQQTHQQYPGQPAAYPPQQQGYPQQGAYGAPPPYSAQPGQPGQPYPSQQQQQQRVAQPVQQNTQQRGSGIDNEDLAYLALASPYYGYGYGGGLVAAAALGGLASGQQQNMGPVSSVRQPGPPQGQQVQGVFDQGARFDPNRPVNVPPPPPGVAPTAAQQAAASGQTVEMSQQKRDVWGLGSDGGATFF